MLLDKQTGKPFYAGWNYQFVCAVTQRDKTVFLILFKDILSTHLDDKRLEKCLIQQHWGIEYLSMLIFDPFLIYLILFLSSLAVIFYKGV